MAKKISCIFEVIDTDDFLIQARVYGFPKSMFFKKPEEECRFIAPFFSEDPNEPEDTIFKKGDIIQMTVERLRKSSDELFKKAKEQLKKD